MAINSMLIALASSSLLCVAVHCKCITTILTTCELVSDVRRYGKSSWDILVIENNRCNNRQTSQPPTDVLHFGTFNKTQNLEKLYISEKLGEIDAGAFFGLKRLKHLKLWGNLLKVLQRGTFANFESLDKLDISRNAVENIAHGFCENSVIREIDLSFNKISNIQVDMLDVPSLDKIKITNNEITLIVPNAFNENLASLDLRYNKIEEIQEGVLDNLARLKELFLSHNKLPSVRPVNGLESLEVLDLSHNNIITVSSGCFANLVELKELYLNNNNITYLPPMAFIGNNRLVIAVLHLHRNNMTILDHQVGSALPELKELTIGANPWLCQCLLGITEYINTHNIQQPPCDQSFLGNGKMPVCVDYSDKCEYVAVLPQAFYDSFQNEATSHDCDEVLIT